MGKKGGWFAAVRKALSSDSSEKKDKVVIDSLNFPNSFFWGDFKSFINVFLQF